MALVLSRNSALALYQSPYLPYFLPQCISQEKPLPGSDTSNSSKDMTNFHTCDLSSCGIATKEDLALLRSLGCFVPDLHDSPVHTLVSHREKRTFRNETNPRLDATNPPVVSLAIPTLISSTAPTLPSSLLGHSASAHSSPAHSRTSALLLDSPCLSDVIPTQNSRLFAVTPETLFLQMATSLSPAKLAMLGCELCGIYFSRANGIHSTENLNTACQTLPTDQSFSIEPYTQHLPLMKVKHLETHLAYLSRYRTNGLTNARNVLPYIVEGSYPPRESALAILFSFPRSKGGYALPKPLMNYQINIPRSSRRFPKSYYKCDLFWSQGRLAVEYESDAFHSGSEKLAQDSSRRNALAFLGIDVMTVMNWQMKHISEMDRIAYIIGRKLGVRVRNEYRYNYQTRKLHLIEELLHCV